MLYVIFRVFRKLKHYQHKLYIKIVLIYYFNISGKRFRIKPSVIFGHRFSIHSDITDTTIDIADNVLLRNNFNIRVGHSGNLKIGANCFFNNNCSINCLGDIEIGSNCQFGENVLMYDHNHRYRKLDKLISEQGYNIGAIKIGNNCWIGSSVVILRGVEIGDNVVIGAGCIIYKSIESGSVVMNQQNLTIKKGIDQS